MEDLDKAVKEAGKLSATTKETYKQSIAELKRMFQKGRPLSDIVGDYWHTIAALKRNYKNKDAHKLKGMCSVVLSLFKYNPEYKGKHMKAYTAWVKAQKEANEPLRKRVEANQPTARQAKAYVTLDEIKKKREEQEEGSQERLLLGMYSEIPPRRRDYHHVALIGVDEEEPSEGNYIKREADGSMKLVMSDYTKTSKKYGRHVQKLPGNLVRDIEESYEKNPRSHLFVSTKTGEPYKSGKTYAEWANAALKRMFSKPTTLTTLRHSYINAIDQANTTTGDLKMISTAMGHSLEMQSEYRFLMKGKERRCVCETVN